MNDNVFINEALNESLLLYLDVKDKKYSLEYNSFLCCVVRLLILIYGEENIISSFKNKDVDGFSSLLIKYGMSIEDCSSFVNNLEKFYNFYKKQQNKAIKKKNKYFNLVQKSLIDMLVKKKEKETVSKEEIEAFYELLFTAQNRDFYRRSVALVQAYNPYEIDDYFKKQNLIVGE